MDGNIFVNKTISSGLFIFYIFLIFCFIMLSAYASKIYIAPWRPKSAFAKRHPEGNRPRIQN